MTKDSSNRFVFSFPETEAFFDRVHDRLHTVVERYVYINQKNAKFTLIVNSVPRDKPNEYDRKNDPMPLRYVSIPKQRAFLEKGKKVASLDDAWEGLIRGRLYSNTVEEASTLYPKVRDNTYRYQDVVESKGLLAEYFDTSSKSLNEMQKFEKPILEHYFNISARDSDRFIAIPLIQFGEIDGFVYIIYEDKDHVLFSEDNIKDVITGFSIEYEGVILAWDLVEEKQDRAFAFRRLIEKICADDNEEQFFPDKSPIFQELNYPKYYRTHREYFVSRFKQHDQMLSEIYQQLIKNGVTTILLDSYAHNISAHAMTTLTWIFKKRSKLKLKEQQLEKIKAVVGETLTRAMRNKYDYIDDEPSETYKSLIEYSGSLTNEIFPFLKFLQEKGAFWSGLIRDNNAGGQVNTLYGILWYDFVANALYLGTIAESEKIRRLHIDITLHPPARNITEDRQLITSLPKSSRTLRLATIDLEQEIKHQFDPKGKNGANVEGDFYVFSTKGEKMWHEDHPSFATLSRFVQPGIDFDEAKRELKKIKIFFPGSVVGKHALFTIIENELRNIKHYFGDILEKAQQKTEGLSLNISIQPCSLGNNDNKELYRIGLWLGLESKLSQPDRADKNPYLVKRRFDMLWSDIIDDDTRQPQLGGNSQDKVCAAMLFNNSFSSVQQGSFRNLALKPTVSLTDKDAIFYPWISPAVNYKDSDIEFQIPATAANFELIKENSNYIERPHYKDEVDDFKKKIEDTYQRYETQETIQDADKKGYLKKYLYLWKGENIRTDQTADGLKLDNLGRFKFVSAKDNSELWQTARENGVIRIINQASEGKNDERTNLIETYEKWLKHWVTDDQLAFSFTNAEGAEIGAFLFDKSASECLAFYTDNPLTDKNKSSIQRIHSSESLEKTEKLVLKNEAECRLQCAHNIKDNNQNMIRYRRHGILNREFVRAQKIEKDLLLNHIPSEKLLELFETAVTRVCLFDNRLESRITQQRFDFYRDKLKLFFRREETPEKNEAGDWTGDWETSETKDQIKRCHFLVMHLSFIDRIVQEKYSGEKGFQEGNIGMFIERELAPIVGKNEAGLRDNFILIVTTGRGRLNWQEFLKWKEYKKYSKNVIFRPVESLIAAMEDSLMLNDDFELKYRLTKVLFGS